MDDFWTYLMAQLAGWKWEWVPNVSLVILGLLAILSIAALFVAVLAVAVRYTWWWLLALPVVPIWAFVAVNFVNWLGYSWGVFVNG